MNPELENKMRTNCPEDSRGRLEGSCRKIINKLEEDSEIKLTEQRTEEEGKERMKDKPTKVETAEEEGIEEGKRIDQTKPRREEEETEETERGTVQVEQKKRKAKK